jgi:hypothetical protein
MIDEPMETRRLLAALEAAVPFEVELSQRLVTYLRREHVDAANAARYLASAISYAGDEGGIMCHLARPEGRSLLCRLSNAGLRSRIDVPRISGHRVPEAPSEEAEKASSPLAEIAAPGGAKRRDRSRRRRLRHSCRKAALIRSSRSSRHRSPSARAAEDFSVPFSGHSCSLRRSAVGRARPLDTSS